MLNKKNREDLIKIRNINENITFSQSTNSNFALNLNINNDNINKDEIVNYETKLNFSMDGFNEKFKTWPIKSKNLDLLNNVEEKSTANKIHLININRINNPSSHENKKENNCESISKSNSFDSGTNNFNEVPLVTIDEEMKNKILFEDQTEDFSIKNNQNFIETIDEFINPVDKQIANIYFKQNLKRHKISKTNLNSDTTFGEENEKELKDSLFSEIYKDIDKENYLSKSYKNRESDQLRSDSSSDNDTHDYNDQEDNKSLKNSSKESNDNADNKSSSNLENGLNSSKLDTLSIDIKKLKFKKKTLVFFVSKNNQQKLKNIF